jgi:hypothetical protein
MKLSLDMIRLYYSKKGSGAEAEALVPKRGNQITVHFRNQPAVQLLSSKLLLLDL